MKKTVKVKLDDGKTLEVSKLPLGKYAELLDAIEELPKSISGLDSLDNDTILAQLPKLIAKSLPDFIKIIHIATGMSEEEVEQLGLDEVIDILKAIAEVNNYSKVLDTVKKAWSQRVNQNTPVTGSGLQ